MKKLIIIVVVVLIFLILFVPIPAKMKDGGTVHYIAILYDVYDVHRIKSPLEWNDAIVGNEYVEGTVIKILGFEIYNNTNPHIEV